MQKFTSSTDSYSYDLWHGKDNIYFYNSFIVNDVKAKGLHFDFVHYWSDEPSSQFKNQYNQYNQTRRVQMGVKITVRGATSMCLRRDVFQLWEFLEKRFLCLLFSYLIFIAYDIMVW